MQTKGALTLRQSVSIQLRGLLRAHPDSFFEKAVPLICVIKNLPLFCYSAHPHKCSMIASYEPALTERSPLYSQAAHESLIASHFNEL